MNLAQSSADLPAQLWLDAQCEMLAGTILGFVFSADSSKASLTPIACWPHAYSTAPSDVLEAANEAKSKGTLIFKVNECDQDSEDVSTCIVATPLDDGQSGGEVVVIELPGSIRRQQQAAIQLLQWGTVWFNLLKKQEPASSNEERLKVVLELLATSLEYDKLAAAAPAAVTELAVKLSCTRVSLGIQEGGSIRVIAVSNSTRVDDRSILTRSIAAAMNEALDQAATIIWPQSGQDLPRVARAQEALAKLGDKGVCVLSTPFYDGSDALGVITLEREGGQQFDKTSRDTCETLAALLGPVIALKRDREKSLFRKALDSCNEFKKQLFGRNRVDLKLYTACFVLAVAFLSFTESDYRVTTQARLEGSSKRVVTAPLDGFIAKAERRAGDVVSAGELLAQMDDQELLLRHVQLTSQGEELNKELRVALSGQDRSSSAIIGARKKQIDAQLALVTHQLQRTQLTAPHDGMIVSGDLSQKIGSPVENGQVLFEIAPLENYRVVLEVDERDIGDIEEAQRGKLTLTGLPSTQLLFSVKRIIPLSTPRDGRNFFEVQAELENHNDSLRPGMEGIGKIEIDQRKLIWVWTHELIDWLRLRLWSWVS